MTTGKLPYRHTVVDDVRFRAAFLDEDLELRLLPAAILFERWGVLARAAAGRRPGQPDVAAVADACRASACPPRRSTGRSPRRS